MARSLDFLANLLESMGYPNLESAHQALLAAALKTKPDLLPLTLDGTTIYRQDGTEFKSSATSPIEPWGKADCWQQASWVTLEETPTLQTQGLQREPKCRFDIVVGNGAPNPATRATAVIECKWGAGTSTHQLLRYGKLLTDDRYKERYAHPLLILVSVDGAPPRSPAMLARKCGVPVAFLTWEKLNPVIRGALGDTHSKARSGLEEAIDKAAHFLTDFGALVLGHQRIPLRHPEEDMQRGKTGKSAKMASHAPPDPPEDEDADPDDRETGDFDSRKQWRVLGSGNNRREFDNATLPERSALFQLAKDLETELNQRHEGAGWRMVSPPHLGPRGDVQCDIAPQHRLDLPFTHEEVRNLGCDADAWLLRVGEFNPAPPTGGEHAERIARAFEVAKSHDVDVDGNGIYLRAVIRLHFSVGGEFSVSFGTGVEPYFNAMLPKKFRPALSAHIGNVGSFSNTGTWQAGATLTGLHRRWVTGFGAGTPKCWVKAGRHGAQPTMWQRYAEVRGIDGDNSEEAARVDRLADAIDHLTNGECDCKVGAKTTSRTRPKKEKAIKSEGGGWFAKFYRACNEALCAAEVPWNLHHSDNDHYAILKGAVMPKGLLLSIEFPGSGRGRPGFVTFQMTSKGADEEPNTAGWRLAKDCTKKHSGGGPVRGPMRKALWRLFVQEIVHEGETRILSAAQQTAEALGKVVDDMHTRLRQVSA